MEDDFFDWQDESSCEQTEMDEVDLYRNASFDNQTIFAECVANEEFNILKFWNKDSIKSKFPKLTRLALGILSIPSFSAASERAFSTSGNILDVKRRTLSATAVTSLMILDSACNPSVKDLLY